MSRAPYESCVRQSEFNPKQLLATEFCSQWWITASHVRRRDSHGRVLVCRKAGAYPLGDMVHCLDCGKWAPGATHEARCVDCQVEFDRVTFIGRTRRWPRPDRLEFWQRYWSRSETVEQWMLRRMPRPTARMEADSSLAGDQGDGDSSIDEADVLGGSLERDQTWGNTPSAHELFKQLRERFLEVVRTKDGKKKKRIKRRGAGCQKALLSENDHGLLHEIAYYRRTGRIVPSARRVSDPFDKSEKPLRMPGQACGL